MMLLSVLPPSGGLVKDFRICRAVAHMIASRTERAVELSARISINSPFIAVLGAHRIGMAPLHPRLTGGSHE